MNHPFKHFMLISFAAATVHPFVKWLYSQNPLSSLNGHLFPKGLYISANKVPLYSKGPKSQNWSVDQMLRMFDFQLGFPFTIEALLRTSVWLSRARISQHMDRRLKRIDSYETQCGLTWAWSQDYTLWFRLLHQTQGRVGGGGGAK